MAKPSVMSIPSETTKTDDIFSRRKYIRAVGRRKAATAVVKLYPEGKGIFMIGKSELGKRFPHWQFVDMIQAPLAKVGLEKKFDFKITATGGGVRGQAEAVRLALARALVTYDSGLKPALRKGGFLTVNSRVKERKKPGLKRARRAPQWQKR